MEVESIESAFLDTYITEVYVCLVSKRGHIGTLVVL